MVNDEWKNLELDRKIAVRVLRFLLKTPATQEPSSLLSSVLLDGGDHGSIVVPQSVLEYLLMRQLIIECRDHLHLGAEAKQFLQKVALRSPDATERKAEPVKKTVMIEGQPQQVDFNDAESPLSSLYRVCKSTGNRFLSHSEYQAGERLRRDFTRGNMMPRISSNWEACVSQRHRGDRNGISQLNETALASRQRVEQAIAAVGPELADVLIDVCCFLKGMQLVERERSWPARSAKVLLKAALSSLHRYYSSGTAKANVSGDTQSKILHWGAQNYRPSI